MYSAKLWQEGGSLDLDSANRPGRSRASVLVALAYSIFNLALTRWIAKPQIGLNMEQHFEAEFRFGLVQVREHAEQVAPR